MVVKGKTPRDEAVLSKAYVVDGARPLVMMMMRTAEYHEDKTALDAIQNVAQEVSQLEREHMGLAAPTPKDMLALEEMLTRCTLKLDDDGNIMDPLLKTAIGKIIDVHVKGEERSAPDNTNN